MILQLHYGSLRFSHWPDGAENRPIKPTPRGQRERHGLGWTIRQPHWATKGLQGRWIDEAQRGIEVAQSLAFRCGSPCSLDTIVGRAVMLGYRWGVSDGN